jgi:hypothetical protein
LHTACRHGHAAVAAQLLRHGCIVDAQDSEGCTPLFIGCQAGSLDVVNVLLAACASTEIGNARGTKPWQAACVENHTAVMQAVLGFNRSLPGGGEVLLHLYGLGTGAASRGLNAIATCLGSGLYHTAVEVRYLSFGLEWSFGHTANNGTGVFSCEVSDNREHRYSHSVSLGHTRLSQVEFDALLDDLQASPTWVGSNYNLLSLNCHSFCAVLCDELSVDPIPAHVRRAARCFSAWRCGCIGRIAAGARRRASKVVPSNEYASAGEPLLTHTCTTTGTSISITSSTGP